MNIVVNLRESTGPLALDTFIRPRPQPPNGVNLYCASCGKELPESARFCPHCGAPVGPSRWEEFEVAADDLVGRVKELVREGNVRRLVVRSEAGETLLEIPVTVGVIGLLMAPYLAALGAIAAVATRCTIAIERRT